MTYKGMLKEGTLNDKIIIVTGGGTGLGKSMSKYFLELGAKIIITSRKEEVLLSAMLNIVTTYAYTGSGYVVPSACAKGGVFTLTRSLASEWVKYGIRCNAIAPGPFPTEGAMSRLMPKIFSSFINIEKKLPMKRFGNHQELANLAAYLMSDHSDYITGEVVTIDGAEWIHKAGEFNWLEKVPKKMWGLISKSTRKKK